MREGELREMFRKFAEPVESDATPPDPRRIRARGRRRRRNLIGGTILALAAVLGGAIGVRAGLLVGSTPSVGEVTPPATHAPPPATVSPATTAPAPSDSTLPIGKVTSLAAVQVTGSDAVVAVGKDTILATTDGRTWGRVWAGKGNLRDVNFSSTSTGWALGDGIVLATTDGGRHWQKLAEPAQGTLRRVHFSSPSEGWGIAGGSDQGGDGPMMPTGATRLVHTTNGGRTWSALPQPAAPQSVCFTSPADGWLASGTHVWRSTDGGRSWRGSFALPVPGGGPPFQAEAQCARPGAAWVLFSGGGAAAGHSPYALYATRDGGSNWRGVLAEGNTLATLLHLPAGPGSYPGPFSVIDPSRAFLLSPTPAAESVGGVLASIGGQLAGVPDIPYSSLTEPTSVGFASATKGWVVGKDGADRAVILGTTDGGHHWTRELQG
jgi:photosystem II stability/assembly factor-like uncharacterized protein